MSEPESLLSIAEAIAEGEQVDWSADARVAAARDEGPTLAALKELETLLMALRQMRDDDDPSTVAPNGDIRGSGANRRPGSGVTENSPPVGEIWRHLAILDTIGHGAFGTVYRAHDARLGVDVALKLLAPSDSAHRRRA